MGLLDMLSSKTKGATSAERKGKGLPPKNSAPAQNCLAGSDREDMSKNPSHASQAQSAVRVPAVNIPGDQAFALVDTVFSAAAPLYRQSVVKKQQRIDQENRAAFNQAAERKATERKEMDQVNARPADGWPVLPKWLDVPGNQILEPSYLAMIEHLGVHNGVLRFLDMKFAEHLRALVKPHKAEKRHLLEAGRKACEETNETLAHKWKIFLSVSYTWDAELDEGSFRLFYPQSKADRYRWAETVKSPYWNDESKAVWKEAMEKLYAKKAQS